MNIDFTKAKILIVDDNPTNIDILVELLQGFDVRAALDGHSALDAVKEELPDLILLDVVMPNLDGYEVCRQLKLHSKTKNIPIIFLSANTDESSIIKGFELGGVDYIKKPYLSLEVLIRVKTHLKLKMSLEYLEHLANVDELTGISNRRRFFKHAHILFEQAKDGRQAMHLFVFDIDFFKQINDTYGHGTGDEVLQAFTKLTKKHLPKANCFARLGGDEFIIILPGISAEQAQNEIEKLRMAISTASLASNTSVKVSVSVGMASFEEVDGSVTDMITRADGKLYKAKQTRNALAV